MPAISAWKKAAARAMLEAVSFKYDWSFRQSYNFVKQALGYVYRRADALKDFRTWKGTWEKEYATRHYDINAPITQRIMVETELSQDYRYRVFFDVTYKNKATGYIFTRRKSLYTNQALTFSQLQEEYKERWAMIAEKYELEIEKFENVNLWHNRGWGY